MIYPPILANTQPPFLATVQAYDIEFTLQNITNIKEIKHIQIRVVEQQSNSSIVKTSKYPDNVIYKNIELDPSADFYTATISIEDLRKPWSPGLCYKIQMRFGSTLFPTNLKDFTSWKKEQIENQTFSEWSTVMIIKAINKPNIYIENLDTLRKDDVTSTIHPIANITPLFIGGYEDNGSEEPVDIYRFSLYDNEDNLIEASDWIQAISNKNYSYRFKTMLTNNEKYKVIFFVKTKNGYEASVDYKFQVIETYLEPLEGVSIRIDNDSLYSKENGCMRIYLTSETPLTGTYVLTRTSERSNYLIYEEIKYFTYFEQSFKNELLFTDFTIESGIKYKYAFQYENSKHFRSAPLQDINPKKIDFEYSYLYKDGIQLCLKFNQKLSSYKHTTLTSKQDTLGSQYPYLVKNGNAYYAEFPISGLISFNMDEDQTFFTLKKDGYYYKDELVLPIDRFTLSNNKRNQEENSFLIDANISDNNIYIERKFREKVEDFLNDFTYKLYKSPTEGNIIVGLMNVSMVPNASLGRMIFEFSATAYEVLENTLDNLNEIGIIDVGEWNENTSSVQTKSFGQIAGIYDGYPQDKDIMKLIKQQEEIELGNGQYKYKLLGLKSFWVERYPENDLSGTINDLKALGETEKAAYFQGLQDAITSVSANSPIQIKVNGQSIIVNPNRIYSIEQPIVTLEVVSAPYPFIINYISSLERVLNESYQVVTSIDAATVWGQISGVFTEDSSILENYNAQYQEQNTVRVYSNEAITDSEYSYIIADTTNYSLYKTKNLYEIIEEETRKLVAHNYNLKDGFYQDDKGKWTNGTIYFSFQDITSLTIEVEPYTTLKIGNKKENAETVLVGATGRYTLSPMTQMIRYIELPDPQFAIIDFKCLTTQTTLG